MNVHTNAHVHTTTQTFTCNTQICIYIYAHNTTHTHMCTQHHMHTGWTLSSPHCKPEWSWQDCGDPPSGWGYSRPAGQGWKFFICHLCFAMCIIQCTLSTTQHSGECEHQKTYPTDNCYWYALENQIHLCIASMSTFSALSARLWLTTVVNDIYSTIV